MALNYETINGATDKIDDVIEKIPKLVEELDTDTLDTDAGDFSAIIEKLNSAKSELEKNKETLKNAGSSMKQIEENVKGGVM